MDRTFLKSMKKTRKKLVNGELRPDDLVRNKELYDEYAQTILKQDRAGKGIDEELRNTLEDYLMICLDVYTYSDNGEVLIPDYTYDLVMNVYCHLFKEERLVYADYIVSTTIWPFVKHEAPFMVGTINRKVYDLGELKKFLIQYQNDGYKRILYAPKFDGISSAITLKDGFIERAVTRNNGIEGQDITQVLRKMNRSKKIFTKEMPNGYYKCELVCTTQDFNDLIKQKPYSNRRSAASAIVAAPSNLPYSEFITAIPLAWVNFEGTQMKYLAWNYAEGMVEEPTNFDLEVVYGNIERILEAIRSADYPIRTDGVVLFPIHSNDDEPNTTDLMANCLAYKVNTQEGITHIDHVYMSVGRLGLAKPMARVEPVEVNETIVRDVSLGSMGCFSSLNLHEHEEVIVYAAGNVIPQLKLPEPRHYDKKAQRLTMDIRCPYCGKKMRPKFESEADIFCVNGRCPRVLSGRIANFLDKLDIAEGFRDATFFSLVKANVVTTIEDLFELYKHQEKVAEVLGSRIEAEKLLDGLRSLKTKTFEVSTVMGALGIDNIGVKTCQNIFSDVSLDYLLSMKKNKVYMTLLGIPGVGDITARQLGDWLVENRDFMEFLMQEMKIVNDQITYGAVCFTGFRNKDYAEIFKKLGFPAIERVTKDVVAVIYAGDTTTANAQRAIKNDVPLIHVSQIDELVKELTARSAELSNERIEYGKYALMRDIRRHVPTYQT
jgi:DNA ligase (NAD+)